MDEKVPGTPMHPSTLEFFQRAQAQVHTRERKVYGGGGGGGTRTPSNIGGEEALESIRKNMADLQLALKDLAERTARGEAGLKDLAEKTEQEQIGLKALLEKTTKVQQAIVGDLKRIVERVQQNTQKANSAAAVSFGRAAKRLQLYASPTLTAVIEGEHIEQDERVCFAGAAITVEGEDTVRVWRAVRRIYTNGHIAQAYVVFSDDGKTLNFDSFALS